MNGKAVREDTGEKLAANELDRRRCGCGGKQGDGDL